MAQISLSRLPWWGQITAFAVLAGAAVFGFWYYYVSDVQAEIDIRGSRASQQLRTDIKRGIEPAKRLPRVPVAGRRAGAPARSAQDRAARSEGLRRHSAPRPDAGDAVEPDDPRVPAEAGAGEAIHEEWPISLELDGTYHNLGMFFDRISKFPRIINVQRLKIRPRRSHRRLDDQRRMHGDDLRAAGFDEGPAGQARPEALPPRPAAGKSAP